ncbi:hypothetical protein HII12_001047 [Brettanomyces bruxellensis]|uniref:Mso1 N-terminal domain-containing protein n=1 Tax=Dekkera bruxellensis TaxID=5007 RepID=A0A8H6EYH3_DEKBR|nr:hypothetical protein HII12_001047 [Brettanomyces bruxellensis]
MSTVLQKFRKISSEIGSITHKEEKDGRTEDDTVVSRSLLKYFRTNGLQLPEWLHASAGSESASMSYGSRVSSLKPRIRASASSPVIPQPQARRGIPPASAPSINSRPRLMSRFSTSSDLSKVGGRSTTKLSRFGTMSAHGTSRNRFTIRKND